jgi:hypothetical protein
MWSCAFERRTIRPVGKLLTRVTMSDADIQPSLQAEAKR